MEIILGEHAACLVKGVENVTLQLNQSNSIHLQNLFYVLDRKKNLVSISEMESKVSGWHSSMERYVFENRIFKDAFEFKVILSYRKSTRDHVH